jgi:hypothetical protein
MPPMTSLVMGERIPLFAGSPLTSPKSAQPARRATLAL